MSKTFFTTELRTRLGTLTLRMIDDREAPTSLEFSYPVEEPVEIRWGESRSAEYGDAVVGSFADLVVPDPEGHFQDFFGTQFNEINWKVLIEGTLDGRDFLWKGRVQQSQFDEPISPRVQVDNKRIRVYDRIGALGDKQPIYRPESMDVEEILMRTLFSAQPDVDIVYKIDAEGTSYFNGRDVPAREWLPTNRSPSTREVGDTEDEKDEGLSAGSLRSQLDSLAERLGLKVWYEPFTGMYHVVHRTRIGEAVADATRITSNGFPLDSGANPSFDRSYQIERLMTTSPKLRAEGSDAYKTVGGVRSVTVDIENAPLVKNPHFKLYEYVNSQSDNVEDFVADFLFWDHARDPWFVHKTHVIWTSRRDKWIEEGILTDFIGLNVEKGDNQLAIVRQQTRPIPEQDLPTKGVLEYQAVPFDGNVEEDKGYVFSAQLEYKRDDGTEERVQTNDITPVNDWGPEGGGTPIPEPRFIETSPTTLGGQFVITASGHNIFFKVIDFKVVVENPSGDNLVVSSVAIQPSDEPKGRKEVSIADDTFYFSDPVLRLEDPQDPYPTYYRIDYFDKATLETVQPIGWSSARYGREYDYLYEYRAADRLAQQPPGTFALSTKVIPGVLTPGRAIDMGTDGRLIFAGGRTVQLTGDEEATTELNDIFIPDVITDPVDPGARPEPPDILLTSFATYKLTAQDGSNIEGYRLYRRNAPGAPGTQVEQTASQSSPDTVADPNPAPGMNLHVGRTYNSNGDSPASREALQLPFGWYKDGDAEFSPNPIPSPSAAASNAVLIDGEMYLFGGTDGSGRHARSWKYDVWADTWTQLPDYPEGPTEGLFAAPGPSDDQIVVGGGIGPSGARSGTHLWYRSSQQWQALDTMPVPVGFAAVARRRQGGNFRILIVHGGEDAAGAATSTVQRLSLESGVWSTLSDAPFSERRHGAVYRQSDDLWYVFGGAEDRTRLWQFDAGQDAWSEIGTAPPTPVSGYGIEYSNARDSAFLIGGAASGGSKVGEPQEYSLELDTWTQLPAMPTPRSEARGVFIDRFDVLFAAGGDDGSPTGVGEVHVLEKESGAPIWTSSQDYTTSQ